MGSDRQISKTINKRKSVDIYLCKTDYDYHINEDYHGVKVYFDEKSLRDHLDCVNKGCGIVKLKLSLKGDLIQPENRSLSMYYSRVLNLRPWSPFLDTFRWFFMKLRINFKYLYIYLYKMNRTYHDKQRNS